MSLRIERMRIDGFGPIRGLDLRLGSVTVIVGDNEAGKSSVVDALHAWLRNTFRRSNSVSWDGVRRNLTGYDGTVEIELAPESSPAPPAKLSDEPVLWNLLVIPEGRAGARRVGVSQRDWLVEAKPHLTGFDADAVRERVRERAGLTPTDRDSREWSDEEGRLAARERAIEEFLVGLESLGSREAELRARSETRRRLEDEAERERAAVDQLPWRRARAALETLRRASAELAALGGGTRDDLNAWRGLEMERARQAARLRDTRPARGRAEERRRAAEGEVVRAESARVAAERRVAAIAAADLPGRIAVLERGSGAVTGAGRLKRAGLAALVLGATVAAVGLAVTTWLAVVGAGILSAGGVLLWAARSPDSDRSDVGRDRAALLADARRVGLDARDPLAIARGIRELEDVAIRERVAVEAARLAATSAAERADELARDEASAASELDRVERRIRDLEARTGLESSDALADRIERRLRLESEREAAASELEALLPGRTDDERGREIDAHIVSGTVPPPTPGALARIERELAEARADVSRLERETAGAVDRGLLAIGQPDLAAARAALEAARAERAERAATREAARLALEVVQEAERDVDGHLDQAFADPKAGASPLFSRLTAGRWTAIRRVESSLEAVGADGASVPVEALSRGTQDQLHLALRAALARRVLGEPAFFVWDDTFLTADPDRRTSLVEAAIALVREGWQVLYLTVDPSIAELFSTAARTHPAVDCRVVTLDGSGR